MTEPTERSVGRQLRKIADSPRLGRWIKKLVECVECDMFEDDDGVDGYLDPKLEGDTLSVTYIPYEGVSEAPGVVERYRLVRLVDEPPPYRCPPQTPYVPGNES